MTLVVPKNEILNLTTLNMVRVITKVSKLLVK